MEARLLIVRQICHSLIDVGADKYLLRRTEVRTHNSNPLKFQILQKATNDSFNYYFPRTVDEWNKLPKHVALSYSLGEFKLKLDGYF